MTLYEISEELLTFLEVAEDEDLDEQAYLDTLEGLQGELGVKLDEYAKIIANAEADVDALDAEIKRLQTRKQSRQKTIDRLKSAMFQAMKIADTKKIDTQLFKFGIAKNPSKVVLDAEIRELPIEYVVFQDPKADMAKIKDAIKAGEDIKFAHLEQGERLSIK